MLQSVSSSCVAATRAAHHLVRTSRIDGPRTTNTLARVCVFLPYDGAVAALRRFISVSTMYTYELELVACRITTCHMMPRIFSRG